MSDWWKRFWLSCTKGVMMRRGPQVIRVELPAMADLLAYLRERDAQQSKIDALAATVKELTAKLQHSGTVLQGTIGDK